MMMKIWMNSSNNKYAFLKPFQKIKGKCSKKIGKTKGKKYLKKMKVNQQNNMSISKLQYFIIQSIELSIISSKENKVRTKCTKKFNKKL